VDEATLLSFCGEHLASFRRPDRIVFLERLPRTSTGKLLRSDLPELAAPALTDERQDECPDE